MRESGQNQDMSLTRRQWLVLTMATVGVLANTSTYGVLAPFYPDLARSKDNTNFQIGLVFSTYAILGFFSSPIVGYLISRGASSKLILVTGLMIGGGFFAIMGFLERVPAGMPFFVANLCCRLVQTLGCSVCSSCFYSIIAAELPNHKNIGIAVLESMFGLGMMVGPALGGFLYELGGYALPCYVFGGLAVVVGLAAALYLPRTELSSEPTVAMSWNAIDFQLVLDLMATACALTLMNYNDVSLSGELGQYGMSKGSMGLVFLMCATVYAVASLMWGSCIKFVGDSRYLVVAGALIAAVGCFAMRPVEALGVEVTLPLQIAAQAALGLGMSAMYVCSTLHGMHYTVHELNYPDDISTHGFISGAFMAAMFSGCFIGPVFGGLIQDAMGYAKTLEIGIYWILITVSCLVATIGIGYRRELRKTRPDRSHDEYIVVETAQKDGDLSASAAQVLLEPQNHMQT